MASLTVRNIPEEAKLRFRQIAAAHGRSMEEHLRHLVIEADLGGGEQRPSHVAEARQTFSYEPRSEQIATREDVVRELIRIADGAGEGVVDSGRYAAIRFMTAKDAMAELRRLANGVGLDPPPRMNAQLEAPDF